MKQFMVMCAVLPLLLIMILQISLDQMNSFKLSGVNNIVYSYAEKAKQAGEFDCDGLKNELNEKLNISPENIVCESREKNVTRGGLIHYTVEIKVKNAMIGLRDNNEYTYVINSVVASEHL